MSDKTTTILGVAGAALTAYRFVAVDGTDNERLDPCGDGARALGVAVAASAAAGDEALVAIEGYALVDFGGTCEPYDEVASDADGKAILANTTNDYILGYYAPEPVDGAVNDIASGERGRIVLYSYKGNQVPAP
jgi:hypothetical protein